MNRRILILAFLFISASGYSQADTTYLFKIYTSPLQLIDIASRQMATLGCEYTLSPKIALSAELGYKIVNLRKDIPETINPKGYSCRLEMKIYGPYQIRQPKDIQDYLSIECKYIRDDINRDVFYLTGLDTEIEDYFGVKKNIYIGNLKYGFICPLYRRTYFDVYYGLGIRYRDVKNIDREYNEDLGHENTDNHGLFDLDDFSESSGLKFNFTMGFKLGVKF